MNNTENILDTIINRTSYRAFDCTPVDIDKINKILALADSAPSAGNKKPWKFEIVNDSNDINNIYSIIKIEFESIFNKVNDIEDKQKLINYFNLYVSFIKKAPVLIHVFTKRTNSFIYEILGKYEKNVNELLYREMCDTSVMSTSAAIQNILLGCEFYNLGACWVTSPIYFQKKLEEYFKFDAEWKLISIISIGNKQL